MLLLSSVVDSISMKLLIEMRSNGRASTETFVSGSKLGYVGMKAGESIIGAPPMALRTFAAIVMCTISSTTTEWIVVAA